MKIKPTFIIIFLSSVLLFIENKANAQQKVALSAKIQQRNFYRKNLQVDSVKADSIANIQHDYKTALNLLMADTALASGLRGKRIQELMDRKNQLFRKMLSPAQQEKMIPASERTTPFVKKD